MTYEGQTAASIIPRTLPHGGRVPLWTWQAVQDRMAEAMRHWWRSHDSDARFSLGGRISSVWQQASTDQLALIEQVDLETEAPRSRCRCRACDMARMVEASEWLRIVPEGRPPPGRHRAGLSRQGRKEGAVAEAEAPPGRGSMGRTGCASATAGRSPTSPMC
jgi:hypothetical protein